MFFNLKFGTFLIKIFIIFILILLNQNVFAFSKKEEDKIIKYSKNFYSDVYNTFDNSSKISSRLSKETSLSKETINSIINWRYENIDKIKLYCEKKWLVLWTCTQNIINKYNNEDEILKLENALYQEGHVNEVWADWDLSNGFFDIVYDLNIIDIILFWEEASIFLYQYEQECPWELFGKDCDEGDDSNKKKGNNKKPKTKADRIKNYIQEQENYLVQSKTWKAISWDVNLTWTKRVISNLTENYWTNTEVENQYSIQSGMCSDPLLFSFKQHWEDVLNTKVTQVATDTTVASNSSWATGLTNLTISRELFSSITGFDEKDLKNIDVWKDWSIVFPDENKEKKKECKKSLYWNLICLDDLKNLWWCSDDKQTFCIEVKYIKWEQGVLWSGADTPSCINCIVKQIIEIIEDNLLWLPLHPRDNSNQNWSVPNRYWSSKLPFKFIDITSVPVPWLIEKDPKDNNKKESEKDRESQKTSKTPPTNCLSRSTVSQGSQKKVSQSIDDCNTVSSESKKLGTQNIEQKTQINSRKYYFNDVYLRIREFRTLFQSWIEENIAKMPFSKFEEIKTCEK